MTSKGDEDAFRAQLRAIDEASAKAQQYLDRTTSKPPHHSTLPGAHWHEIGTKLSVAEAGQPRCEAKAIELVYPPLTGIPNLILRNPESCVRPLGHDGEHVSRILQHPIRKSRWKALAWDSEPIPTAVLLSPDFNAPSPLWPSTADAMVPQSLLNELIAWQREFDSNYDWEVGWRSEEAKRDWADASVGLVEKVREALVGKADLTVNLWPLGEPKRH